ncbi:hypothetical protein OIO90_003040 [Microbotryomycetes sp. JL221]|nr:hypothetical protein OIO90_003040 [Microbotryomycetes sp. JL221]
MATPPRHDLSTAEADSLHPLSPGPRRTTIDGDDTAQQSINSTHEQGGVSFKKRVAAPGGSVSAVGRSSLLGNILSSRDTLIDQQDRIPDTEDTSRDPRIAYTDAASRGDDTTSSLQASRHYSAQLGPGDGEHPSITTHDGPHAPGDSHSVHSRAARWTRSAPLRDPLQSPSASSIDYEAAPNQGDHAQSGQNQAAQSTPLPTIPIIVLCIAMFGEFLSASLSSPFLYFMIESFGVGQGPEGGGEATVGFWTGIVSQFLTSLLWMSVAEKHGRRAVLFSSLIGNGLAVIAFGTSKNLASAITTRFAMGLFNGAVGVARSAVQSVTDPTNEARAITYMGLCWGLGGIVGSIIGGLTESPVKNFPSVFGDSKVFAEFPYLLPCLTAGSITLSGGMLSLWLNREGGPREGQIRLTEKDVDRAKRSLGMALQQTLRLVLSCLGSRRRARPVRLQSADDQAAESPALSPPETPDERSPFRTRTAGSAYGYSSSRRTSEAGMRIPSGRRLPSRFRERITSMATTNAYAPDYDVDRGDFSFAQRLVLTLLLLANEQAVFSISDLWIAREAAADDELSQVDYDESVFVDEESHYGGNDERLNDSQITYDSRASQGYFGYGTAPPSVEDLRGLSAQHALTSGQSSPRSAMPARAYDRTLGHSPSRDRSLLSPVRDRAPSYGVGTSLRMRRPSMASSALRVPSIFSNTGLNESTIAMSQSAANAPLKDDPAFSSLAAIPESGQAPGTSDITATGAGQLEKTEPFSLRQLPLSMIAQYSLLALHGCTCDQVFMSFLVTPIPSGGLGLKAANYAALVAAMVFFNTCWQFKFYPFVGPPNGPLSHLAMFRLGLVLYIPVYLLFPELRGLLRENSTGWVMFGMTLLSAIRYLANTCSYTAVMVLVNAMSPPHLVPLANGLAQSTVSLARFIGPVVGGIIWSASIAEGPTARSWPFNYSAGFVVIALLCFAGLLHSFRLR